MGNFHLAKWSPWFFVEDKLVKVKPRPIAHTFLTEC